MDIVGSTKLGRKLDPEDEMEIVEEAMKRLTAPVTDHGGRVARFTGDGFKSVFGIPVGHENDAEEAVRAGLEILRVAKIYAKELENERQIHNFQVRVGIDTGLVVAGGRSEGEDTIKGTPVNLGVRTESAAPPGGLLITHNTYQHIRGLFDLEPMPPIEAKGFDQPVQVYLVTRAKRVMWEQTRGIEGIKTRLVGRETELKHLQDAFSTAIEDCESQVVTIVGEAGIGKSRMLHEFSGWIKTSSQRIDTFEGIGRLGMQNSPYSLLRDLFSFRFGIQDSDQRSDVCHKIEAGFGEVFGKDEDGQMRAHFIGQLLGFDFSSSPHLEGVLEDAQQLRDRALIYLGEYFQLITEETAIGIFLEDVHWGDDVSLDVIDYLVRSNPDRRLLLVCLMRPALYERRPYWGEGQKYHLRIDLNPLTKRESRKLIDEILQKVELIPIALRELVVSGAEGNPFFIEELLKMLIDDGVIIKEEERWLVESVKLADTNVPTTLTGVLQARLDNLPQEVRTTLQQASVVGRVFWDNTLERIWESEISGKTKDEIRKHLTALRNKEMIYRREISSFEGSREYFFRHTILQEVTYETVLKRLRPKYHGIVADWMIEHSESRFREFIGIIADHLEQAGRTDEAVTYLHMAGLQAAKQYANDEALEYFNRGLEMTPEDDLNKRYDLLLGREQVYSLHGQPEAQKQDIDSLEKIALALKDDSKMGLASLRKARFFRKISDYPAIIKAAKEAIRLGQKSQTHRLEAAGNSIWGRALLSQGNYSDAKRHINKALTLAREMDLTQIEADCLLNLGVAESGLGDLKKAKEQWEQSLHLYRQIGNRRGEGRSINHLGNILHTQGDITRAREYYDRFLSICQEIGDRWGESLVVSNIGEALLTQADYTIAGFQFERALELTREVGNRTIEGGALVGLANVHLDRSDYTRAFASYEASLALAREIGNRPMEGKTLMQIGRFFHRQGDYFRARRYYDQSIFLYRELGNRLAEARVLSYLGLLSHHMGDNEVAKENGRQALDISRELGHRKNQGLALTLLGHTLLGLGLPDEAEDAYQRALEVRLELDQTNLSMEPLAGLAWVSLAKDNLSQAQTRTEEILSHLQDSVPSSDLVKEDELYSTHGLEGTDDPMRILLTCYQVLKANEDPRTNEVLRTAFNILQEQADKIEDVELRHLFLHNVAANLEIMEEYRVGYST
jgi:predicted ATPase/class 3 adenylate cyclase